MIEHYPPSSAAKPAEPAPPEAPPPAAPVISLERLQEAISLLERGIERHSVRSHQADELLEGALQILRGIHAEATEESGAPTADVL